MKITLLATLLFISIAATAQIKKGAISIGGDIAFAGNKTENTNTGNSNQNNNATLLSLTAGKAVKDNFFIGAGFIYASVNQKITYTGGSTAEQKSSSIGGSLWARKYYPVPKSFYIFVNGGVSVAGISGDEKSAAVLTTKESGINIQANLFPGISYQVHKNFFLDASINNLLSLNYSKIKMESKDNQGAITSSATQTNYSFASSVGSGSNPLQIGVRWIIQK